MPEENPSSETYGLLAEFDGPEALLHACTQIRDEGFKRWDAHVPFPLHGLEAAMGVRRSWVSLFVLVMGLSGAVLGMLMQWWVAEIAYPLVISGKPLFSWPAFVPVMFECGVLGGASGAILGFLILARLPQHHHPLFNTKVIKKASDDGFLVSIEAADPRYDAEQTPAFLKELGAIQVETVAA